MKKTQEKIIITAINLFNKRGTSNVRLQDIATMAAISPGNLTYHYKTKKDLMEAVLAYMSKARKDMALSNQSFLEATNWIESIKTYLHFQIHFRFFYRDILEITNLVPEARSLFERQIQQVVNFSKNAIYLSIGKGYMLPEPHEGHYTMFSKNAWAILHSWLTERETLGEDKVSLHDAILALLEFHFRHLTEKGKAFYYEVREQLPTIVEQEMRI